MNEKRKEENQESILAQWQTCVEMANAISERRDTMNNLFVTLNTGILAGISYLWTIQSIILTLAGLFICFLWILFINNFKHLNTEKFQIINALEARLPEQPFSKEWERLRQNKKYIEGTKLEQTLPVVFAVGYVILMVVIIRMKG